MESTNKTQQKQLISNHKLKNNIMQQQNAVPMMAQNDLEQLTEMDSHSTLILRHVDVKTRTQPCRYDKNSFKLLPITQRIEIVQQWVDTDLVEGSPIEGMSPQEFENWIWYLLYSATIEVKQRIWFNYGENYRRLALREQHDVVSELAASAFNEDEMYAYRKAISDLREAILHLSLEYPISENVSESQSQWDIYEIEACEIQERTEILLDCMEKIKREEPIGSSDTDTLIQFLYYLEYKFIVGLKDRQSFNHRIKYQSLFRTNFRDIGFELEEEGFVGPYIHELNVLTMVLAFSEGNEIVTTVI